MNRRKFIRVTGGASSLLPRRHLPDALSTCLPVGPAPRRGAAAQLMRT